MIDATSISIVLDAYVPERARLVDMLAGEPVQLFGVGGASQLWHAIAREYLERWAHHSQIRRALGLGSLADAPFLEVGHRIITTAIATSHDADSGTDEGIDPWAIGQVVLGSRQQAADVLTLAHTAAEVADLVHGPSDAVSQFAALVGRR